MRFYFFLYGRNFFKIIETEDMKMKKIKMKKLIDFCTKKEHTQSIQLCNDLIKKIVQRGEQVLCSGN